MGFLPQCVARLIGDSGFTKAVERIVSHVEPQAFASLAPHSQGMSAFEARGYIRARSMMLVSKKVDEEIQSGIAAKHRQRLIAAVREGLIQALLPRLMQKAQPVREVGPIRVRRAA